MSENETTWYEDQINACHATPRHATPLMVGCMNARTHLEVPITIKREPLLPAQAPEECRVSRYERGGGGHPRVE
jgi:hypothetical protein